MKNSVENKRPEYRWKGKKIVRPIGSFKLGFQVHSRTGNIGATLNYRLRKRSKGREKNSFSNWVLCLNDEGI